MRVQAAVMPAGFSGEKNNPGFFGSNNSQGRQGRLKTPKRWFSLEREGTTQAKAKP
jgi:hypothetical protein